MSRVDRFAAGAIGEPGQRVFMLEVDVAGETVAYVIEKLQVAALAEEAKRMLRERGLVGSGLAIDPGGVHDDSPVAYRVGGLELALSDDADAAQLVVHSTEDADPPAEYQITLAQLDAFAREALVVVEAGRPTCPRCGLAMDPEGHPCPRGNGDLRNHQP